MRKENAKNMKRKITRRTKKEHERRVQHGRRRTNTKETERVDEEE
jgi:hypothetical protein